VGFARPAHAAPQSTNEAEATLTADLNQERTSRGLAALTTAPDLVAYAEQHSADMAAAGHPYHDPNIQSNVQNWQELGDNVGSGPDADHLHQGFMNSQIHRDEILHPSYTEVGVGCYWAGNVLYVTEVFRLPENAKAPAASAAPAPARQAPSPRVVTRSVTVPAPAARPAPAPPAAAPSTTAAPTTTAAPSPSTSVAPVVAEQWPPASVLAAHQTATGRPSDTSLQALAAVAAVLLMLVAGVEVHVARRRAART
jgi:hypothetical protein